MSELELKKHFKSQTWTRVWLIRTESGSMTDRGAEALLTLAAPCREASSSRLVRSLSWPSVTMTKHPFTHPSSSCLGTIGFFLRMKVVQPLLQAAGTFRLQVPETRSSSSDERWTDTTHWRKCICFARMANVSCACHVTTYLRSAAHTAQLKQL